MRWGWTEEARRTEWPKWKARGKVAFLWHVGILRFGVLWGAGMLVYWVIEISPHMHASFIPAYAAITAITIFIAALFGLSLGLLTWWGMMKKYG
jgi:hypothetical protein